ncbi:hypothetical protein GGR56DRAFT_691895 [Xylariaceae sp. FL0804]|nr:hypothetical protein GGR56DRAFT_691895 [Xylariaceae sp. FL0804]
MFRSSQRNSRHPSTPGSHSGWGVSKAPRPTTHLRSSRGPNRPVEYYDQWSPRDSPDHDLRVQLHRQRRESIRCIRSIRERSERSSATSRPSTPRVADVSWLDSSSSSSSGSSSVFSRSSSPSSSSVSSFSSSPDLPPTSAPTFADDRHRHRHERENEHENENNWPVVRSGLDLTRVFQERLDHFAAEIAVSQDNEWASTKDPRAPALRIDGAFHSARVAGDFKQMSFAQAFTSGFTISALRDSDRLRPPAAYAPGTVFSTGHHTADGCGPGGDGGAGGGGGGDELHVSTADPHRTATPFGTVHSKFRKFVVWRAFAEHCVCLPLYTHHGRGLDLGNRHRNNNNNPAASSFAAEFVSVRDAAERHPEPAEGPHGAALLAWRDPDFRGRAAFVGGRAVVKLTEPYCHRYDVPATIEGALDGNGDGGSAARLFRLVAESVGFGSSGSAEVKTREVPRSMTPTTNFAAPYGKNHRSADMNMADLY